MEAEPLTMEEFAALRFAHGIDTGERQSAQPAWSDVERMWATLDAFLFAAATEGSSVDDAAAPEDPPALRLDRAAYAL